MSGPGNRTTAVGVRPARGEVCQIHEWPDRGIARRFVRAMRDPTGVDVCVDCAHRAKLDACGAADEYVGQGSGRLSNWG